MGSLPDVYDPEEFRSVDCNVCTKVCSNYPAYYRHMWKNHGDAIRSGRVSVKPRRYDVDDSTEVV